MRYPYLERRHGRLRNASNEHGLLKCVNAMQHFRAFRESRFNDQDPQTKRLFRRRKLDWKKSKDNVALMTQKQAKDEQMPLALARKAGRCDNVCRTRAEATEPSLPCANCCDDADAKICESGRGFQNRGARGSLLDHLDAAQPASEKTLIPDYDHIGLADAKATTKHASPRNSEAGLAVGRSISVLPEDPLTARFALSRELLRTGSPGSFKNELTSKLIFDIWNQERTDERNRKGRERSMRTRIRNAEKLNALNAACALLQEENMRAKELIRNIYLCLPMHTSIEVVMLYVSYLTGGGSANIQEGVQDCIRYLENLCTLKDIVA